MCACFLFIDFVLSVCCFQLVYFKFKLLLFKQAHVHVHVDIHMHTDVHMLILFVILHYTMRLQISQSACMAFVCLPNRGHIFWQLQRLPMASIMALLAAMSDT